MSLYLYDKTDTSFNNEGLGVLLDFVTDPEVTENINGFFELTFTYALGGHLAEHLNEEMYISSKTNEHDDEYLVFRIYESEPDYVDGSVIIRARLKQTDDFMNSIVKARTLLKGDIGFQLRSMMSNSTPTLNYRVGGTVDGVLDIEREDDNIFNMLFDDNGLFTLNGVTPKFTPEGITITKERAWSTSSVITEKNFIEQLTINTSRHDMVTQIIPFTETRRDVLTPNEDSKYHKRETIEEKVYGKPVISPKVANMGYPVITRFMEFRNDVKEELKMDETEYNTYLYESVDDLNEKAKTFFTDNEGIDEYEVEVSIETLGLHMDDYEQISSLGLYDMVEIYLEEYGVNVPVQVMEVTYSPLIGRNTQLKLTSKLNRFEHASNRINSNAPSEQQLREFIQNQIINNKINETVHNFIIKDDGTKISYVNQLPPVETAIEGDVVFLITEEGGSIWEFVNGAWVEVLPLNFKQYVTDQLTEVFNQFDTERTETEQAINEALDSAKAEAERLDEERQTLIDGQINAVISQVDSDRQTTSEAIDTALAEAKAEAERLDAIRKTEIDSQISDILEQSEADKIELSNAIDTALTDAIAEAERLDSERQLVIDGKFEVVEAMANSAQQTADSFKTNFDSALQNANFETIDELLSSVNYSRNEINQAISDTGFNTLEEYLRNTNSNLVAFGSNHTDLVNDFTNYKNTAQERLDGLITKYGFVDGNYVAQEIDSETGAIKQELTRINTLVSQSEMNYFYVKDLETRFTISPGNVDVLYNTLQLAPNTKYTLSTDYVKGDYDDIFFGTGFVPKTGANGVSKDNPRTITTGDDGKVNIFIREKILTNVAEMQEGYRIMLSLGETAKSWIISPKDDNSQEAFRILQAEYEKTVEGIRNRLSSWETNGATKEYAQSVAEQEAGKISTQLSNYKTSAETETFVQSKITQESDKIQRELGYLKNEQNLLVNGYFNDGNVGWNNDINRPVSLSYPDNTMKMWHQNKDGLASVYNDYNLTEGRRYIVMVRAKTLSTSTLYISDGHINTQTPIQLTTEFKTHVITFTSQTNYKFRLIKKYQDGTIIIDSIVLLDESSSLFYANNRITETADSITRTLESYAKTTDLNGLATESFATNIATTSANNVMRELTKYAKTTDLNGLATESFVSNKVDETANSFNRTIKTITQSDNLLVNPYFLDGLTGWNVGSTGVRVSSDGTLRFNYKNSTGYDSIYNDYILQKGKTYKVIIVAKTLSTGVLYVGDLPDDLRTPIQLTTEFKAHTVTFKSRYDYAFKINKYEGSGTSYIKSVVLIDTSDVGEVKTAVSEVQQQVDRFKASIVGENGSLTALQMTVDGIDQVVSNPTTGLQTRVSALTDGFNVLSKNAIQNIYDWNKHKWVVFPADPQYVQINHDTANSLSVGHSRELTKEVKDERIYLSGFAPDRGMTYTINFKARAGGDGCKIVFGQPENPDNTTILLNAVSKSYSITIKAGEGYRYAFTFWPLSNTTIVIEDFVIYEGGGVSQGQLQVTKDMISQRVAKGELISEINTQAGSTLITAQSGTNKNILNVTPTTTYIQDGTIKSAHIEELNAGKITSGTIDTARLDTKAIVTNGLQANVIKSTHILADNALFEKLFTNDLATQNLATQTAWISNAMVSNLDAGKITTGTINSARIDAKTIVTNGLQANVIKSTHILADNALFEKLFTGTSMTDKLIAKGAWITNANISNLDASKITTGTINSARIDAKTIVTNGLQANVIKSTHILADNALFEKLFTNDLATQKLATKQAWIKTSMIGDAQIGTAQIGQIDAGTGKIVNIDAQYITANHAKLVSAGFKGLNSNMYVDGGAIRIQNNAGDFATMNAIPEFRSQDSAGTSAILGKGRSQYYSGNQSRFYIGSSLSGDEYNGSVVHGVHISKGQTWGIYRQSDAFGGTPAQYFKTPTGWGAVQVIEELMRTGKIVNNFSQASALIRSLNGWGNSFPVLQPGDMVMYQAAVPGNSSGIERIWTMGTSSNGTTRTYSHVHHVFEGGTTGVSDARLKHDIKPTDIKALDHIADLSFKQFKWNRNDELEPLGLIAQESGILRVPDEEMEGIDIQRAMMLALKGIQELSQKLEKMGA